MGMTNEVYLKKLITALKALNLFELEKKERSEKDEIQKRKNV